MEQQFEAQNLEEYLDFIVGLNKDEYLSTLKIITGLVRDAMLYLNLLITRMNISNISIKNGTRSNLTLQRIKQFV